MTNAGEVSDAVLDGLPAGHPQPPQCTTRIPDCGVIPLDGLGEVDHRTLSRLLPSGRRPGPGFNSGI
ncbi:hypothetical protein [Streptomyces sp. AC555_RSS877]|uniref:hypothetical protein n=1 Tax=Streptomyces sp. AC555_RSS877 TaxID=2823688 RepID=UPI001C26975A|nr:hypothetical protein [Streptomyces sp. AC555_RSS877]